MLASTTGSTNATGAPIGGTGATPTSDKAPLVSKKNRLMRRVSGIFGSTEQPTTHDGYVEFGHLDSSNVNVGFAGFADSAQRTLGTFAGVFSPVALSMFSALVFIRVGYIVGNAGLLITLLQFVIAYGILVFTVASVCAISTNGAVEGGGAYFMISRTLGPEFGGSIGTLFFLANIVGSALCISGFSEAIVENFGPSGYLLGDGSPGLIPDGRWYRFLYCSILNTINLCVCLVGASTFAKTSVAILAAVSICLSSTFISFFAEGFRQIPVPDENELIQNATYKVNVTYTGLSRDTLLSNLYTSYGHDYTSSDGHIVSFAATFGVLFSGVTGIMAGANMSGELKSPARSIPSGTLSAVLFTFIVYVALSILTAATCSRELLQNNYMYMMPINIWPPFVSIGVMTATFSASLSNLIGSSRVLEALAKDRVFGSFLNFVIKGTWHSNPIAAVLVSWFLVQIMFFVGSLNAIAQINSVLFLLSYLATNMACLGLQLASAPNFRPSFKCFTWHTASVGLFGTIAMMFVINPVYSSCSIALCVALVACLHFFGSEVQGEGAPYWGSISQALIFHQVRKYLLLLDSRKDHVKYWRPQILLLVSNPRACCPLIDFVNDIKKGGLYVLGHVFVSSSSGEDISTINPDPTQEQYPHWLELVDHLKIKAFVELTEARSVRDGFQHLVRISGMGAMKPNTVILGFYDDNIPIDFLSGETSYKTDLFDKTSDGAVNENLFKLRHRNEAKKYLDAPQYVSMIKDGLALGKNVCVCRHFDKLDKNALLKNSKIKYMDVWAVNALAPRNTAMAAFDTTALFMMQLAVICRMVGLWKRMAIRVYIATTDETVVHRLQELLKLLRIRATIHEVPNWSSATDLLQGESVMLNSTTNTYDFDTDNSETIDHYEDVLERSNTYKYLTRFNELIRLNSQNTAVTFLYLPAPPGFVLRNSAGNSDNSYDEFSDSVYGIDTRNNTQSRKSNSYDKLNKEYLNVLSILTEQLPPTVLVHGLNTVTSTTL